MGILQFQPLQIFCQQGAGVLSAGGLDTPQVPCGQVGFFDLFPPVVDLLATLDRLPSPACRPPHSPIGLSGGVHRPLGRHDNAPPPPAFWFLLQPMPLGNLLQLSVVRISDLILLQQHGGHTAGKCSGVHVVQQFLPQVIRVLSIIFQFSVLPFIRLKP